MSFAIGFVADVALARQIFHHLLQILLALSCQACVLWAALLLFLLPGRAFGGTTFLGALFFVVGCAFSAKRSGATIAVASRATWPMRQSFTVAAMTAACSRCANSLAANSANARENLDSCGNPFTHRQPQNWRNA